MGTRSAIFSTQPDGTYEGISVRYDGYISGVGLVLENFFNSQESALALTATHTPFVSLGATLKTADELDSQGATHHYTALDKSSQYTRYSKARPGTEGTQYYTATTEQALIDREFYIRDKDGEILGRPNNEGVFMPYNDGGSKEFVYLWKNEQWYVCQGFSPFVPLAQFFTEE